MTILPLIERELRVRARRRAVYWARFAVALAGILICLPTLVMSASSWSGSQAALGHSAFNGLVVTAFFLCCCAGLLTADSISRERREGTLGLLSLSQSIFHAFPAVASLVRKARQWPRLPDR